MFKPILSWKKQLKATQCLIIVFNDPNKGIRNSQLSFLSAAQPLITFLGIDDLLTLKLNFSDKMSEPPGASRLSSPPNVGELWNFPQACLAGPPHSSPGAYYWGLTQAQDVL